MTLNELKKSVDFEKFIISLGFSLDKKHSTRRNPVYQKQGDKIRLKQGDKFTVYVSIDKPDSGTIVDFCLARENELLLNYQGKNSLEKVYHRLMDFLGRQNEIKISGSQICGEAKKDFSLENEVFVNPVEKNIHSLDYSYLKKRGISQAVLSSPVFSNTGLSKNSYGYYNLAFPLFNQNDEIKGVVYRYYNSNKGEHIKIFVEGSDKLNAIGLSTLDYQNASEIVICESDIDCMSHYQLHRSDQQILYIACEGYLAKGQISNILSHIQSIEEYLGNNLKITLAFDNDESGQAYTIAILLSLLEREAICVSPDVIERGEGSIKAFGFGININTIKSNYSDLLEDVPGIRIDFVNEYFKIRIPREMQSVLSANKLLLSVCSGVKIERPIGKDFNADLLSHLELEKKNIASKKI